MIIKLMCVSKIHKKCNLVHIITQQLSWCVFSKQTKHPTQQENKDTKRLFILLTNYSAVQNHFVRFCTFYVFLKHSLILIIFNFTFGIMSI